MTISSHIISFRFLSISGQFQATQKNQNWSRKTSCNWGKNFIRLFQKERFLEPIEKKSFVVITGEPQSALFWWPRRFIFSSFIYLSFVTDNTKPTCLDCVNIYSCILLLLKLQGTFCFMNQMCCTYLILAKSVLVTYTNLFDFWLDKRQRYVQHMAFFFFFYPLLFRNNGEVGAKKYSTDHQTANTVQLFVAIKGHFSGLFFFWISRCESEFPKD